MKRNLALYLKVLLAILVIVFCFIKGYSGGDFKIYMGAAELLKEGKNCYNEWIYLGGDNYCGYSYSPLFAIILIPFTFLPYPTAQVLWLLLSCFLLYRSFKIIKDYFNFSELSKMQYKVWVLLSFVLSFQFILYNFWMVQMTIFLLWAILESFNLLFKEKYIYSGLLLALVINIKIMPILILPYLFYRGYFKTFVVAILAFVILLFIPSLFIGYKFNMFLLSEWWSVINPANKEHMFETGIGPHSLSSLLPVYLIETKGELDYKRNILNLGYKNVGIIINITRLFILALSLLYFKTYPFRKELNKLKSYWEFSFFMLIIPLLMPHQQKHSFLLVLPMIMYLLYFFITTYKYKKTISYTLALCMFVLCMLFYSPIYGSSIIGIHLFLITQHFRLLSIATLLIIPISLYCSPYRIKLIRTKYI